MVFVVVDVGIVSGLGCDDVWFVVQMVGQGGDGQGIVFCGVVGVDCVVVVEYQLGWFCGVGWQQQGGVVVGGQVVWGKCVVGYGDDVQCVLGGQWFVLGVVGQ